MKRIKTVRVHMFMNSKLWEEPAYILRLTEKTENALRRNYAMLIDKTCDCPTIGEIIEHYEVITGQNAKNFGAIKRKELNTRLVELMLEHMTDKQIVEWVLDLASENKERLGIL